MVLVSTFTLSSHMIVLLTSGPRGLDGRDGWCKQRVKVKRAFTEIILKNDFKTKLPILDWVLFLIFQSYSFSPIALRFGKSPIWSKVSLPLVKIDSSLGIWIYLGVLPSSWMKGLWKTSCIWGLNMASTSLTASWTRESRCFCCLCHSCCDSTANLISRGYDYRLFFIKFGLSSKGSSLSPSSLEIVKGGKTSVPWCSLCVLLKTC